MRTSIRRFSWTDSRAESEQGITIDVDYRYFQTARRRFIVADTPGHEQYTRNMATGASTADLAVILVDAKEGSPGTDTAPLLCRQPARHSPHAVLAVNKMDLVGWDQRVFDAIVSRFGDHAERLGFVRVDAIPVSAVTGANIFRGRPPHAVVQGPDTDRDFSNRRTPVEIPQPGTSACRSRQ